MSMIDLSVKHGRTLEDARVLLRNAVNEVMTKYGTLVQRVEWADDGDAVKLAGTGFHVEMRIDVQQVHVTGDIPIFGALFSSPLVSGLKGIIQQVFQKRLP